MASKLVIPFNYQPFSVSVKTGAYTIPTGYYAYVTASVQGADSFSIGGVVALQGQASVASSGSGYDTGNVNLNSGTTNTTYSYTVPTGYKFQFHSVQMGSYTNSTPSLFIHSGEVQVGSGSGISYLLAWANGLSNVWLAEGNVVNITQVTTQYSFTKEIWGTIQRETSINAGQSAGVVSGNFWVSSGTALTTTGGAYTVTLYPNIS